MIETVVSCCYVGVGGLEGGGFARYYPEGVDAVLRRLNARCVRAEDCTPEGDFTVEGAVGMRSSMRVAEVGDAVVFYYHQEGPSPKNCQAAAGRVSIYVVGPRTAIKPVARAFYRPAAPECAVGEQCDAGT